jgi:hypothetical protein
VKRRVENWTLEDLEAARPRISFPEYQRQPNLWTIEKKRLLIDSILQDIDIPKLYFNETRDGGLEVVDGTQRLWSIWEFVDDEFTVTSAGEEKLYSALGRSARAQMRKYQLQVTILEDAPDEYLRELFVRLQLGLLLVTGEKLHAATGKMKDLVFKKLPTHSFVKSIRVPERRYAKETLCAQIAINSFTRAKTHEFARTRYEDLLFFFKEYEHPSGEDAAFFRAQSVEISRVLDRMGTAFGKRATELTNRSYILSMYLLVEDLYSVLETVKRQQRLVTFAFALWNRLREESSLGIDRKNRELYSFQTLLSSAPGERYQIERRHSKLLEYLKYFETTGKVKGD